MWQWFELLSAILSTVKFKIEQYLCVPKHKTVMHAGIENI